jgi:hypothetical protein
MGRVIHLALKLETLDLSAESLGQIANLQRTHACYLLECVAFAAGRQVTGTSPTPPPVQRDDDDAPTPQFDVSLSIESILS